MVIYLKNASSLVLELCRTFFTGETQSSITYCNILYLLVLSITNTLYLLSILEISWSGFALHKWWQNAQFLPLGELSAHPATILQQLLKMIAGVDISEVEVNDGEFSRGAKYRCFRVLTLWTRFVQVGQIDTYQTSGAPAHNLMHYLHHLKVGHLKGPESILLKGSRIVETVD